MFSRWNWGILKFIYVFLTYYWLNRAIWTFEKSQRRWRRLASDQPADRQLTLLCVILIYQTHTELANHFQNFFHVLSWTKDNKVPYKVGNSCTTVVYTTAHSYWPPIVRLISLHKRTHDLWKSNTASSCRLEVGKDCRSPDQRGRPSLPTGLWSPREGISSSPAEARSRETGTFPTLSLPVKK